MNLFLIAHKVRGQVAFDVAEKMQCSVCEGTLIKKIGDGAGQPCDQCENAGYWWIISTFGHRAYPFWHEALDEVLQRYVFGINGVSDRRPDVPPLPENLRDFFAIHEQQVRAKPAAKITTGGLDLLKELGL